MAGVIIAGTRSGCGKTTVSTALMGIFRNVQPFKAGPDYIDPMFHRFITGKSSYNLDLCLLGEEKLKYIYKKHSLNGEISLIEGVMGLYDGYGEELDNYSTAHLARVLGVPVILAVSGNGSSTSVAAEVLGFKEFDKRVNIAGVIVNRVSGKKHYEMIKESIERYTGIECIGYLESDSEMEISERHLGLMQALEISDLKQKLERLKEQALKNIDFKRIKEIAERAREVNSKYEFPKELINSIKGDRIAVARDEAFSFYYDDNLEMLREMGYEIVEFSPLRTDKLPDGVDSVYLGGGYPENYAKKLSENRVLIEDIKEKSENGLKIYGECGGFIYLCKTLKLTDGISYNMCGIFDIEIEMKSKLNIRRFGYVDIDSKFGLNFKAHEFHYSEISKCMEEDTIFTVKKEDGRDWKCGYKKSNSVGGYPHIHFYSKPEIIYNLFNEVNNK